MARTRKPAVTVADLPADLAEYRPSQWPVPVETLEPEFVGQHGETRMRQIASRRDWHDARMEWLEANGLPRSGRDA